MTTLPVIKNGNIFFYGKWLAKVTWSAMAKTYNGRYGIPYVNGKLEFNAFILVLYQTKLYFGRSLI